MTRAIGLGFQVEKTIVNQTIARLQMLNLSKSYPGVRALDDVSIDLMESEVLAIIGENGAGKSTLIKMLGGAHLPDSGEIWIEGHPVQLSSPMVAQNQGIGVIFQEFNLIPYLTVAENIFLGQSIQSWGLVHRQKERQLAADVFERLGMPIDPDRVVASLSIAEQQVVEIAKALQANIRVLVMDEPTATLTSSEVEKLFEIVNQLKSRGLPILYVSHRLDEVLEIADRVVVLRDGRKVAEKSISDTNRSEMIQMMVGREIAQEYPKQKQAAGPVRLKVRGLSWKNRVQDVSFEVRAGEVLGVTGLVGSGRTEVARLIAGAERIEQGEIQVDDQPVRFQNPREAIRKGIAFLTEDRKGQGLVLNHSLRENFGLPNLKEFSSGGILNRNREQSRFENQSSQLQIKHTTSLQLAGNLSGGNQQKLVLAKWLEKNCDIIIVDEPTRGIDVGAKYEIYLLLNELAAQGKAIIMISSELPEVLGMSDRILVMRQGRIMGEILDPSSTTQDKIMELAAN